MPQYITPCRLLAVVVLVAAATPVLARGAPTGVGVDPSPAATQPTAGSGSPTRTMKPRSVRSRAVAPVVVTGARQAEPSTDTPEMRARVSAIAHGSTSWTEGATDAPSVLGSDASGGRLKSGPTGPR